MNERDAARLRRIGRRYAPFLLLAAVQLFLVAVVPSTGDGSRDDEVTFSGSAAGPEGFGATGSGDGSSAVGGEGEGTATDSTGGGGTGSGGGPGGIEATKNGAPGAGGASGLPSSGLRGIDPAEPGPWPWSHSWTLEGDRGKCADGGELQETVTGVSPPCVPAFGGGNGGKTSRGVTADKVTVVVYRPASNAAGDAILGQQDLAASAQEDRDAVTAYQDFFNKHYEFYGRKLELILHEGNCDGVDPTCNREDARLVVNKYQPFYVIWDTSAFPSAHDELARLGVVNSGGWHFHPSFRQERRPFTWDLYPDGVTASRHTAAYWCTKMGGKPASLAGDPTLRAQPRQLGIVTQDFDVYKRNAAELAAMVGKCGAGKVPIYTYNYDIARGQEQMTAIVAGLKDDGVTTVTCLCDPVMPVFLTNAADQQQYFPEWLISGLPAMSHDFLGRLYSGTQWRNAFGPSMRPQEVPKAESDHEKAWRDVGRSGHPAYLTLNRFMWIRLAAMQIQWAGPNLTPLTLERGTLDSPQLGGFEIAEPWPGWKGGIATVEAMRFGPGDYTGHEDAKHVRWSPTARSVIDGKAGSYVCIEDGCPRFFSHQWRPGEPAAPNG